MEEQQTKVEPTSNKLNTDITNTSEILFSSIENKQTDEINNTSMTTKDEVANNNEESNDHLPRVQIELDKLNYANESINNLELELEDSKKEYIRTIKETEDELNGLEKKLGSCVEKSRPYYDARIELNDAKEKYYIAKHRFETAQELYVAAKNVQLYAEENLENFIVSNSNDAKEKETLAKILEIAKIKVNDTELSKQSSDVEQISAFKVYEERKLLVEQFEKELKKSIEKSKKYFELKSTLNKELRFLFTKIEGLKSCLKEAKLAYQQSLNNLELISTEIHTQRQSSANTSNLTNNNDESNINNNTNTSNFETIPIEKKLISPSSSNLSSPSSSSSVSSLSIVNNKKKTSDDQLDTQASNTNDKEETTTTTNEDYDIYFSNNATSQLKNEIALKPKKISDKKIASRNNSQKLSQSIISDDDIENIGLDIKLKMYQEEINDVSKRKITGEYFVDANDAKSIDTIKPASPTTEVQPPQSQLQQQQMNSAQKASSNSSRPQFRVPAFFKK